METGESWSGNSMKRIVSRENYEPFHKHHLR